MVLANTWQAWCVVAVSGLLEVCFSIAMKFSEGFSRPLFSVLSLLAGMASVWLVGITLQLLPVGTAYAVWADIGAVGTAVVGMVFLGESVDALRLVSMALVVAGIVGLQLSHG